MGRLPGNQGGKSRHEEMKPESQVEIFRNVNHQQANKNELVFKNKPGEGNHVDSELPQVGIQLAGEPKTEQGRLGMWVCYVT